MAPPMHAAFSFPVLAAALQPQNASTTPRCGVSRRAALQLAAAALSAAVLPCAPARAESTYEKNVRLAVGKVSLLLAKSKQLGRAIEECKDPLPEEDVLYVLRFIPIWLEPGRIAMRMVGEQTRVDVGDRDRVVGEADAVFGHLLELKEEAKAGRKSGVLREVDELCESCEKFLALPGIKKFVR